MVEAAERVVNLALFLVDAREPVGREAIQAGVEGYEEGQQEAAFLRMFERDKDLLRDAGFAIVSNEQGEYVLDKDSSLQMPLELNAEEAAVLRAVGTAFVDDPAFPFPDDLRLALTKLSRHLGTPDIAAAVALVDSRAKEQGALAGALVEAADTRKHVEFDYTTALGASARRHVEPYGLFVRDGRWYLVGNDTSRDDLRVFALERMSALEVNTREPRHADFERPADFDLAAYILLPFQYGEAAEAFDAVLAFGPDIAWRATAVASGRGSIETLDGAAVWKVSARSRMRLAQFVLENGPGITIVEPEDLYDEVASRLQEVIDAHA